MATDGRLIASGPQPFQPQLDKLLSIDGVLPAPLVIGLDMPIGLPEPYARRVGITDFCRFLKGEEGPDWSDFSTVSERLATVTPNRPFFPKGNIADTDKQGGKPQQNWLKQLGMEKAETYRRCDLGTDDRASAASLFWTKGANQVGKAALSGWSELIAPLLRHQADQVGLWPFDGDLAALVQDRRVTVVEAYPGEIYGWFGCKPRSKTKRDSRLEQVVALEAAIDQLELQLSSDAKQQLADGFGDDDKGEDRFDCFVGALGLVAVLADHQPAPTPEDPIFRSIEGWILGQSLDCLER